MPIKGSSGALSGNRGTPITRSRRARPGRAKLLPDAAIGARILRDHGEDSSRSSGVRKRGVARAARATPQAAPLLRRRPPPHLPRRPQTAGRPSPPTRAAPSRRPRVRPTRRRADVAGPVEQRGACCAEEPVPLTATPSASGRAPAAATRPERLVGELKVVRQRDARLPVQVHLGHRQRGQRRLRLPARPPAPPLQVGDRRRPKRTEPPPSQLDPRGAGVQLRPVLPLFRPICYAVFRLVGRRPQPGRGGEPLELTGRPAAAPVPPDQVPFGGEQHEHPRRDVRRPP